MAWAGPSHAPDRALHAGHSSDARDDLDASLHTDHHPAPPFLDDRLTPTDSIAVSPHRELSRTGSPPAIVSTLAGGLFYQQILGCKSQLKHVYYYMLGDRYEAISHPN